MDGRDEYKHTKCSRCGVHSVIRVNEPIENRYCECGGKFEYDENFEYFHHRDYSSIELKKEEDLSLEYQTKFHYYDWLGKELEKKLNESIKDKVKKFRIEVRIKDFDKFYEKIQRKYYTDPFNQIEDICGLRIICYYSSDFQTISKIIKNELNVLKLVNKSDVLNTDEFGYRSMHFIVQLKIDETDKYKYKNLEDLKAEIQVRTLLMHAHASIEHDLTYKKGNYVPPKFVRQLSKLSATLEVVDDEFDHLRKDMKQYYEELQKLKEIDFDLSQELTLDTLQDFLDFYFPDRETISVKTAELFSRLKEYNDNNQENITLKTLFGICEAVKDDIDDLERKNFAYRESEYRWHQSECLCRILMVAYPNFVYFFSA